ncbi:MAG: hypothetical protein ACOZBZ_02550 [Patescibacteria group bacterium]
MKKIIALLLYCFIALLLIYLLLPLPAEPPPLPGSLKSTEPGDTVEIPGLFAYYTDLSRSQVLDFYQKNFSRSSFLGIPLLTYRLNHPPEYARETIRRTLQSTYYEEIVHPLRESLYVNGYEWENDPFTKPESREKNKPMIGGKEFRSKVTVITRHSNPIVRLLVVGGFLLFALWLIKEAKEIYGSFRRYFKL